MGLSSWMKVVPWIAVFVLSFGYWSQVWKIHKHREVRDLSVLSFSCLALGFLIMSWQAHHEGSTIFLVKQLMTLLPVLIIISQIFAHGGDKWHDDDAAICSCGEELEQRWDYCPKCGVSRLGEVEEVVEGDVADDMAVFPAMKTLPAMTRQVVSVGNRMIALSTCEAAGEVLHLHCQIQLPTTDKPSQS